MASPETIARPKFEAWLNAQLAAGQTKVGVAEALGVEAPSLWQWISLRSRPNEITRARIRIASGIVEDEWSTPEELAERQQQMARAAAFGAGSRVA